MHAYTLRRGHAMKYQNVLASAAFCVDNVKAMELLDARSWTVL